MIRNINNFNTSQIIDLTSSHMNNIFNELLKSGQKTMTNVITNSLGFNNYNSNGSNNNYNSKQEKLRGQLQACTYPDDKKFAIEKAIKPVFHVYPNFDTDILSFKQGNVQRRFLELKAILQIDVRGKTCKVDFNMMIPAQFPQKSPYVRIINRNPDFIVDDFYKTLQSPSDAKSYILNEKLHELKTWDQSKSIVNVIIESYDLMRNKFPFSKPGNKSVFQQIQQNQNYNSPWNQLVGNQNGFNNNTYNNNNSGFMNYIQGGGFGNPNYNGQMGQQQNFGFNNQMNKPPIPFSTGNITQIITNGQKFVEKSKKNLEKIKNEHVKALQSVQALDTLRCSIQSEENFLRKENIQMSNFLQANENNQASQSLTNLVTPRDEISEQIIQLVSSIKARQDCTTELQSKFNEGAITLDDFMKHLRKLEFYLRNVLAFHKNIDQVCKLSKISGIFYEEQMINAFSLKKLIDLALADKDIKIQKSKDINLKIQKYKTIN